MPLRLTARFCVLLAALAVAPLSLATHAGDPPAAAAAPSQGYTSTQVSLRFASPVEVAAILQATLNVTAIGSERSGVVVVSGQDSEVGKALDQAAALEAAAAERIRESEVAKRDAEMKQLDLERMKEEQRRRINEASAITVDFGGGTVAEYLDAVRTASRFENIVIGDPSITKLKMPTVKVKRVTGAAAVMLLQSLRFSSEGRFVSLNVAIVAGDPAAIGIDADPVLVIDLANPTMTHVAGPSLQTQVFDLAVHQKVEPERVKALLDAIQLASSMHGGGESFQLKLHEPTGLLIAHGTPDDLELVQHTIRAFTGQSRPPQSPTETPSTAKQ